MAQNEQIDPYEFLGIPSTPAARSPEMSDIPSSEYQDPYDFLGISPGVGVARPRQSATSTLPPRWNLADQFFSGLGLGFGPELQGTEDYLRAGPSGALSLYQHIYNAQQEQAAAERSNPGLYGATEILGSLPTVVGANMLTPGVNSLLRGGAAARMAGNALVGAEAGALQSKITGGDIGENALTGAALGAGLSGASSAVGRLLTPKVDPNVIDLVRDMEALGVKLRPSQVAMSSALRRADEFFASGGNPEQVRDFTRAVGRTFGEDVDAITPEVAGRAWDRITSSMDWIAAKTFIKKDPILDKEMAQISSRLSGLQQSDQRVVRDVIRKINKGLTAGGGMGGETYQELTRRGGAIMNLASHPNPNVRLAGGKLREMLDEAISRNNPSVREAWDEARSQFKNLITVQPLIEGNPTGIIDPRLLKAQVKKRFDEFGWGPDSSSPLQTLATGGQLMPKVEATGGTKEAVPLRWYMRPSTLVPTGAALGGAEMYLMMNHPLLAAGAAATATGLAGVKSAIGAGMRSSAYRNALTGTSRDAPSWMQSGRLPALTGAINELNNQFEGEEE